MSVLNKKITVIKQDFEKRWGIPMNQSLEDAFNDILSNFPEAKVDENYNNEMNQFLMNDKGDIYYFDNYKYIYPKKIDENSEAFVLNNSRGLGNFCCVKYNVSSIIVENYNNNGVVEISSYFLTDETRDFIKSDFMNGNMGEFLFQVSGNNKECIKKLQFGSKIIIRQENGSLVSYNTNGNAIDSVSMNEDTLYSRTANDISFYRAVETKVDYYELLNRAYSLSNEQESSDNHRPVR